MLQCGHGTHYQTDGVLHAQDGSSTVSQPDPALTGQQQEVSLAAAEAQFDQGRRAYNSLLERITPWLFEVGSWIFGGLIAFTILIMASLITVGPADLPVTIATTAFALALPLDVTGLVLLRIVRDVRPVGFEEEIARTFQEAGLTPGEQQIPSLTTLEAVRKRGIRNVLYTALGILTLSSALTLTGMMAALWHVGWWIATGFAAMVVTCVITVQIVMVTSQPPISAEEKARRRRQREELIKQAKERGKQAKEQGKQAQGRR